MGFCFLGQHEWAVTESDGFFSGGSRFCKKCYVSQVHVVDPTASLLMYTTLKVRQIELGYCPCCKGKESHTDSCYFKELERQFDVYVARQVAVRGNEVE